jgi:putative chitinase
MITVAALVATGIPSAQAQSFAAPLQAACDRFSIDTPGRMAAFVAQCAHESSNFTALEEGLFYRSADRICKIFPSRVANVAAAQALVGNPQALADCVYAGRNGNGDEASGDGYRFRGRGLIQLTGRANYERAANALARDYIADPDLVAAADDACLTAGWFWDASKLNALADAGSFDAITRAVNGPAMAGAAERRELFELALRAFSPEAPADAERDVPAAVVERGMPTAAVRAAVPAQAPAEQASVKRAPVAKAAPKKPAAKRPAAKKAATGKPAAKKKTLAKKAGAKKSAGRNAGAKKPGARKTAVKKATRASAKRAAGRKPAPKKATAKKAPAKTATAKRTTTKRTTAKRATTKRAAPGKVAPKKAARKAVKRAAR